MSIDRFWSERPPSGSTEANVESIAVRNAWKEAPAVVLLGAKLVSTRRYSLGMSSIRSGSHSARQPGNERALVDRHRDQLAEGVSRCVVDADTAVEVVGDQPAAQAVARRGRTGGRRRPISSRLGAAAAPSDREQPASG